MFNGFLISLAMSFVLIAPAGFAAPAAEPAGSPWYSADDQGRVRVDLYFFWSRKCPHCLDALPFVRRLEKDHPWVKLHSLELTQHPVNVRRYRVLAAQLGQEARSVPAFVFCGTMATGFDSAHGVGARLLDALRGCHVRLQAAGSAAERNRRMTAGGEPQPAVSVPLLGTLNPQEYSLPVLTVVIAALDAFNPCAFFVLLFLLSMLVHARNRARMLIVGGTFVLVSGVLYFVFMAAWLNLFLVIGHLTLITAGAGLLAVAIGLVNIKDYFRFRQGVSLTIPEGAKPGLFKRMGGLLAGRSMALLLLGTVSLALFANLYELLCTAGFPMVFTRILTLQGIGVSTQYLYLLLYNVIYVVPLVVIVLLFTASLGSRKLAQEEGRILKLLSGLMMFLLGVLLLLAPELLNRLAVALSLLAGAVAGTLVIVAVSRSRVRKAAKHKTP